MDQNINTAGEQREKCFIGNKEVPCPNQKHSQNEEQQTVLWERRLLPEGLIQDKRSDTVFISILLGVIILILILAISKVKIFGKTLIEYIKPICLYILGSILIVFSQYLIVIPYAEKLPYLLNVTQALWALMVGLSVMKLSKEKNFNLANIFFLGLIYCIVIHGLKVSIRYFFYESTLFYVADRFIYGSLLVMLIVVILGPVFIFLRNRNIHY